MITKQDYKIINENLERFIYDENPIYEEDLIFDHRLCDMLYENKYVTNGYFRGKSAVKTKTKVGLEITKQIALDFFGSIKSSYRDKLEKAIEDGTIEFRKREAQECSYFEFEDNKNKMIIYLNNDVEDIFNLVHEFMHYLNSSEEVVTVVTKFYTESFSTFIELMLCDYIIENYPKYEKDSLKMRRNLFESLYQNNIKLKFMLSLVDLKMAGNEVNSYMLADILEQCDDNKVPFKLYEELFFEFIDEIKTDIEESYSKYLGYTVGMLLGCKMYDVAKDKKRQKEIFDISDNLYMFYADEVLAVLDLECQEGLNLEEHGYEELERIYIKQLKRLW